MRLLASTLAFILCLKFIKSQTTYTNPVLDKNFPDPTILRSSDGAFYIYATQGNNANIQVAKSLNAVDFDWIGDALPTKPNWASETHDFWAPHVMEYNPNEYYMYFASGQNNENSTSDMCTGVAYSTNPIGPFIDALGYPLMCNGSIHDIDPMTIIDPISNNIYIFFGSLSYLRSRQLSTDYKSFAANSAEITQLIGNNKTNAGLTYENLIEASWIHYNPRNKYFYYFFSGDDSSSHYAVLVARSKNIMGPYERKAFDIGYENDIVIQLNSYFTATGHNSIYTDKNGNDWIYYHAYKVGENTDRVLMLDRIYYDDNLWPMVNGSSPSYTSQHGPVV